LLIKFFNFLFFIFLVRELSIAEYGIYTLVWAQVNFFTPLLDFGTTSYGLVYINNEKKKELDALFSFRMVNSVIIFFLTLLFSIFYLKDHATPFYVLLTSFAIFGNGMYGSLVILMSLRQKAYLSSVFSLIFTVILVSVSSIVLFLTKSLTNVFFVVFIMYSLNALVSFICIKVSRKNFSFTVSPTLWKEIISKSYVFVLISFFLGIYFKIDVFILKILKSENDVGIYSAGYKFFESLLFIIGSYNISATPELASLFREKKEMFYAKMKRDSTLLFVLGFSISLITYFIAPLLLSFVLKQNSAGSIRVLQIVIYGLPLMLLATVLTNALYIFKKATIIIVVYVLQIALNIILNLVFIPRYSYIASAYITVLNELINVLILFLLFLYFKKNESKH
jgi:O-antigen/teichoic acid export membrane protein